MYNMVCEFKRYFMITNKRSDEAAKNLSKRLISRGFKVLSVKGTGRAKDRVWTLRCNEGHTFKNIGKRMWSREKCPMCHCASMEEQAARLLIESHFKKPFPTIHPEWLKSEDGYVMELDMFNEELNLAIEYNGMYHYKAIFGQDYLEKTQKRDAYKKDICEKSGVKLIQIPASESGKSKTKLINHIADYLKLEGIKISSKNKEFVIKQNLFEKVKAKINVNPSFTELLKRENFELVEGVYENRFSRLRVKHVCGKTYGLSFKEMCKITNKGMLCKECDKN